MTYGNACSTDPGITATFSILDHFISCKAELHFCNCVDNTVVSIHVSNIIHPSAARITEQQVAKHKAYNIERTVRGIGCMATVQRACREVVAEHS